MFSWIRPHRTAKQREEASEQVKGASEGLVDAVRRSNTVSGRYAVLADDARQAAEEVVRRLRGERDGQTPPNLP
jgi:hypothetical protein